MAKKRWQRRLEIALLVAVIGVVGGFIANYYYDHWQSLSAQESGEDMSAMAMRWPLGMVSMEVTMIVTHLHLVKRGRDIWWHSFASVIAFYSVAMTYFGVNMYLSGMHSYGNTEGVWVFTLYLALSLFIIIAIAIPSYRRHRHWR